jgi:MoaA/NifB/PqqE/SkfB family radical SAM enzyme
MRVPLFHFSGGGEPTLHSELFTVLRKIIRGGSSTALTTNGWDLSPDIAENVDYLRVSLNASNRYTFSVLSRRGEDIFDRLINNVETSFPRARFDAGLAFLLLEENVDELYDFCGLAKDCHASWVHIRPAFLFGNRGKDVRNFTSMLRLAEGQILNARRDFSGLDVIFNVSKFDGYWTDRLYDECLASPLNLTVRADGGMCLCQDRTDKDFGVYAQPGDVKKFWGGVRHKDLVRSIDLEACPRCVMGGANEIMDAAFRTDRVRKLLL